ncbi:46 kDa FK506-binding nuclear protein-like [Rhopilema esculentum]|uniref:46 kDa FK506-binding nuclear protein-like n=1 Tax=Rhopilema esculentum TaxID=499914 RepID=UPI0031E492DC
MFWGITLEHGKVYSQIVEMPFHISMAALGLTNIKSEATTVMVESDKAEYALCTLQAGKIPQQALDLNFTEGEEVKFFLEGDGGDVHLTGYLLETPREYEYEEEDDEDLDGMLSSDDDSSSMESNQEGNDEKDDSCDDAQGDKIKNDVKAEIDDDEDYKEGKSSSCSSDDSNDSDIIEKSLSWQAALVGDLDDEDADSDSEDNEWKPTQKKSPQKSGKNAIKKKKKANPQKSRTKKPISQTLLDLMDMDDSDDDSDSDKDWAPTSDDVDDGNGNVNTGSKDSSLNGDHKS